MQHLTPRILSLFVWFFCASYLPLIILPHGMIETIETVTLEITNISSSSTLYTTTMYTITVPVIE
jgi:hypothetical protein